MVMAYIIFVNPVILGFTGVPSPGKGLRRGDAHRDVFDRRAPVDRDGARQQLSARARGGMGSTRVVAFELVAGRGLSWPQAMTVVLLEGVVITLLVLTRFREAVMDAVPIGLKRAISVGIGLFIAFIAFHRGVVVKPQRSAAGRLGPQGIADRGLSPRVLPHRMADGAAHARRPALGILGTTVIAIVLNEAFAGGQGLRRPARPGCRGRSCRRPTLHVRSRRLRLLRHARSAHGRLVTFSIMLSDFFDTRGRSSE